MPVCSNVLCEATIFGNRFLTEGTMRCFVDIRLVTCWIDLLAKLVFVYSFASLVKSLHEILGILGNDD